MARLPRATLPTMLLVEHVKSARRLCRMLRRNPMKMFRWALCSPLSRLRGRL
jgi:hypothetical protein